jgi:hypothetical protein
MEDKQKLTEEIWNLHRKADQLRSMNNSIRENYSLWNKIILGYVTIGSAICAMLLFADITKECLFWIGIFTATIFIVSLVPTTFAFESKMLERSLSAKLWGEWIRSASNFCNTEINSLTYNHALEKQIELVEQYKKIMTDTPTIPDSKFNNLKQAHLQKIEISKALDKTPFKSIRAIKKELENKK